MHVHWGPPDNLSIDSFFPLILFFINCMQELIDKAHVDYQPF